MLTISELARFVGVTVKAVRHYHKVGLLPEPERDVSGYRRYGADAVTALVRIKTLAEAGVPLARVEELMRADADEFAAATAEIDADLARRTREIRRHRQRIARLASGDGLVLPEDVVAYLDRLRACGVSERMVALEREGWVLVAARHPDRLTELVRLKSAQLDDPALREIYRMSDEAWDWPADDPRLPALADALADFFASESARDADVPYEAALDDVVVSLLDSQVMDHTSPAWPRLNALLEERGWSGWTNVRPSDAAGDGAS